MIPEFTSIFALLDVMKGRVKLASHIKKHGPVRVIIEADIVEQWGGNDGISIEFEMKVLSLKVSEVAP